MEGQGKLDMEGAAAGQQRFCAGDRMRPMSVLQWIGESRWGARVVHHFPPGQFGRYLAVGVCNTVFGYGVYAGLTALLTPHVAYAYIWASLIGSVFSITFAFFNYKIFVFKTKGNYLREWSRCIVVYGGA